MQELIAEYLLQHKKCALPEIGTLEISSAEAKLIAGEHKITSQVPIISFSDHVTDLADLQNYISVNKAISPEDAGYQLQKFCKDLTCLQKEMQFEIPGAGNFYITHSGKLAFHPINIPQSFLPQVQAERVIHMNIPHAILVGDTETTNAAMQEFFNEEKHVIKSKWWIGAVILFLLSVSAIIFYINNKNSNSFFGSSYKPEMKSAPSSYRKIP